MGTHLQMHDKEAAALLEELAAALGLQPDESRNAILKAALRDGLRRWLQEVKEDDDA